MMAYQLLYLDLNALSVDPRHQRKGIGQSLVRWGIERAKQDNKSVIIVANPTGAPLYRKMGLEEIAHMVLFVGESFERDSWVFLLRH
jgi:predicted N-acetyltransferase YhbS